jgi:hypothetical protein
VVGIEGQNGVVAFAAWTNAGREKQRAIVTKRKTARKRDDVRRQDIFAGPIQLPRKRHDRALAAKADIVAAVPPQIAAARIQSFHYLCRAHDLSVAVEGENPIGSAVDKEQSVDRVDPKPARIDDAWIVAEYADQPALISKGEKFAEACTIRAGQYAVGAEECSAARVGDGP